MKKTFPGHFSPTEKELERLWESCLFTLDTNILLNLYRYSDTTRKQFIGVLNAIRDRLWLPHRAAEEYFEKRLTVIYQQEKAYDEAIKAIQTLRADLSNVRQHPFLSDKVMQKLTPVLDEVAKELTSTKATHANRTSSDDIQNVVGDLFSGRVGLPYSDDQLEAICKEGVDRYARKVPPGFMDDGKDDGTPSVATNHRKYGDLIVWRQVMDRATGAKKGVIFVTDDKKEDWWLVFRGKTLGPRPELVGEFLAKTGQGFYMYQPDHFLKYAAALLKQEIAPESMDEIRDLTQYEIDRQARLLSLRTDELRLLEDDLRLRVRASEALRRLEHSRANMAYLEARIAQLEREQTLCQERLYRSGEADPQGLERSTELRAKGALVEKEMDQALKELKAAEISYEMTQKMMAELQVISRQRSGRERG